MLKLELPAGCAKRPSPPSVVREASFVSRPQKRAYGIERMAYGQPSRVGIFALSIRSYPQRDTLHDSGFTECENAAGGRFPHPAGNSNFNMLRDLIVVFGAKVNFPAVF